MKGKSILEEYIEIHDKYKKKYGENTVVLMEVGGFFELYAVINDSLNVGPDIYHICQNILQIAVTKRNKKIDEVNFNNYLQAGFPNVAVQKFENILLNNNYTVVIVEHITPPPNPERGVTRVVSPGTSLTNYNKQDSHYLMTIYIEKFSYINKDTYLVGVSTIDLSTGKNYLHSIVNKIEDSNFWRDEVGRYIHFYNPSEILFQCKNYDLNDEQIIQYWDIYHNSIQINHYNDKNYYKLSYQNEFFTKVFNIQSMITPIEHFDLGRNPELILSYIYLLQYVYDHRPEILKNIEEPILVLDDHFLCLTSNSIRQLNVINNYSYFKGKNESLLSVCNACVTPMGRRLFKERLLYPSMNPEIIEARYDFISLFQKDLFYEKVHSELKKVSDLEKSLRKMGLELLQPSEFFSDSLSFDYLNKVMGIIQNNGNLMETYPNINAILHTFKKFHGTINQTFNFHNFSPHGNLERSIFQKNIFQELDDLDQTTEDYYEILKRITSRISQLLDSSDTSVKLDFDEKNNWHIYCTNKRAITLKERLTNLNGNSIHVRDPSNSIICSFEKDNFSFRKKDKGSTVIDLPYVNTVSKKLQTIQYKLIQFNKKKWIEMNRQIYKEYNQPLKELYLCIADIDFYCSGAKVAIQNSYCRPKITYSEKSFFNVKGIRHPIVEKIHTDTEYVTNDIELSQGDKDGILLFGTNACGKSTFMKSIGLNIILAQAGLFVSASSFEYMPYTQIFTRILNNDNIFRSQSSFAVEVHELKSILNRADSRSLVLGDELCSGTESTSALSIIATGLNILCDRESTFIFTSHLHELTKLDEIKSLLNLEIYHLKIKYDKHTNLLMYDRKLEKGSGPSIYGLRVCEAMGMSDKFLSFAKKIQSKLENDITHTTKQSQYNTDVFMNECKVCFTKDKDLETHHIKDQQFADKNNMIDHHHKNVKHNLVPLCKGCHLKVTNHELIIDGWRVTSQGKILEWRFSEKVVKNRKKFSEEQTQQIKNLRNQYSTISQKDFIKKIDLDENIKVSLGTLKKIMDDEY